MLKQVKSFLLLVAFLPVFLASCRGAAEAARPGTDIGAEAGASEAVLTVTVSVLPQKYFVERIGGDLVRVNVMVDPGASPHSYEPKPDQMRALSDSAAYFSIGVEFEDAWLERIAVANDHMLMVNTIANIERVEMAAHEHEDEGGEAHDGEEVKLDPHVWTSPELVKTMSQTIYETLVELDPSHEAEYSANFKLFVQDIDVLQAYIKESLTGLKSSKFMVFHPSWGYFAREFGLEQISIEVDGQEPSARELAGLIDQAKADNIKVVFAQPEFNTKSAEVIANEIGGKVLLISALEYDWLDNMRTVAQTFAETLAN